MSLYYTEKGSGEALILLHGNNGSGDYFKNQTDFFAARFRVISVDTRGHGRSPRGIAPFTLTQFSRDLRELMDKLSLTKANILGFSDGGNIALLFALDHPERVSRLVLNGANLFPAGVKPAVQLPTVLAYGACSLCSVFSAKAACRADMLRLMVKEPHIRPEALSKLTMPALVIVGTNDMISAEHSALIAKSLPAGRLESLEGTHFIAAESPRAFNEKVLAFLSE